MPTLAESSSAPSFVSSSSPRVDPTPTRRQELTQLVLAEKSYFQRVAASILRSPEDAEDAVHSAFCSAWKAIDSFRGDSSLKTWFTRIVQNSALIALRKGRINQTVYFEENPEYMHSFELRSSTSVEDPERIAVRRERLHVIRKHIESLPEETRIVFTLHFSRDFSIETIARIRQKSRPSVVSHLQRGKAILRRKVQRSFSTRPGVAAVSR